MLGSTFHHLRRSSLEHPIVVSDGGKILPPSVVVGWSRKRGPEDRATLDFELGREMMMAWVLAGAIGTGGDPVADRIHRRS